MRTSSIVIVTPSNTTTTTTTTILFFNSKTSTCSAMDSPTSLLNHDRSFPVIATEWAATWLHPSSNYKQRLAGNKISQDFCLCPVASNTVHVHNNGAEGKEPYNMHTYTQTHIHAFIHSFGIIVGIGLDM